MLMISTRTKSSLTLLNISLIIAFDTIVVFATFLESVVGGNLSMDGSAYSVLSFNMISAM